MSMFFKTAVLLLFFHSFSGNATESTDYSIFSQGCTYDSDCELETTDCCGIHDGGVPDIAVLKYYNNETEKYLSNKHNGKDFRATRLDICLAKGYKRDPIHGKMLPPQCSRKGGYSIYQLMMSPYHDVAGTHNVFCINSKCVFRKDFYLINLGHHFYRKSNKSTALRLYHSGFKNKDGEGCRYPERCRKLLEEAKKAYNKTKGTISLKEDDPLRLELQRRLNNTRKVMGARISFSNKSLYNLISDNSFSVDYSKNTCKKDSDCSLRADIPESCCDDLKGWYGMQLTEESKKNPSAALNCTKDTYDSRPYSFNKSILDQIRKNRSDMCKARNFTAAEKAKCNQIQKSECEKRKVFHKPVCVRTGEARTGPTPNYCTAITTATSDPLLPTRILNRADYEKYKRYHRNLYPVWQRDLLPPASDKPCKKDDDCFIASRNCCPCNSRGASGFDVYSKLDEGLNLYNTLQKRCNEIFDKQDFKICRKITAVADPDRKCVLHTAECVKNRCKVRDRHSSDPPWKPPQSSPDTPSPPPPEPPKDGGDDEAAKDEEKPPFVTTLIYKNFENLSQFTDGCQSKNDCLAVSGNCCRGRHLDGTSFAVLKKKKREYWQTRYRKCKKLYGLNKDKKMRICPKAGKFDFSRVACVNSKCVMQPKTAKSPGSSTGSR